MTYKIGVATLLIKFGPTVGGCKIELFQKLLWESGLVYSYYWNVVISFSMVSNQL